MNFQYDEKYFPPAPILEISLAIPEHAPQILSQRALIDTGSDGTFIPTSLLEELDVPVVYSTNVRSSFADELRRVSVHKVDILIGSIRLPNIEVISDDWNDELIIGRNVLNKLSLFLDGPGQLTTLK